VVAPGRRVVHQGLAGTTLAAEITSIEDRDGRSLVTVEVAGDAWPTGDHVFRLTTGDPIAEGLVL
jgi:proline racemase